MRQVCESLQERSVKVASLEASSVTAFPLNTILQTNHVSFLHGHVAFDLQNKNQVIQNLYLLKFLI
jgi:hypothetical protein